MLVVSINRKTRERTILEAYPHPKDLSADEVAQLIASAIIHQKEKEAKE
jgi:hypothetical protein